MMMNGNAQDAAMVILGMPSKNGGSRRNRREEEEHDEEMIESEETNDYSDEQLGMASELRSALDSGSDHDVVSAIHGIMMSYQDYE
jgi:hypothetical protein